MKCPALALSLRNSRESRRTCLCAFEVEEHGKGKEAAVARDFPAVVGDWRRVVEAVLDQLVVQRSVVQLKLMLLHRVQALLDSGSRFQILKRQER
jgi:hypothetical protein